MLRKLLEFYRRLLYRICGRSHYGILSSGIKCNVEDVDYEHNHGDIVHPCVRYEKSGIIGHKWWMVYTPYYKANAKIENPILCYGDSNNEVPPINWFFYSKIVNGYSEGYNSDPNLLFDNGNLHIFWRENQTRFCKEFGLSRATRKKTISTGHISTAGEPLLSAEFEHIDCEVSPAFQVRDNDYPYVAYATAIKFFNPKVKRLPRPLKKFVERIFLILDLAGIAPMKKSYGIAKWTSNDLHHKFHFNGILKILNKNHLYHPWHLDVFDWNDQTYAVIQSNQCNADILLAKIIDNTLVLYKKPLLTNHSLKKVGLYKPTALVIDGNFILYYTAQEENNREKNSLYMTSMNFNDLLKRIE